jgi:hypothetical protein
MTVRSVLRKLGEMSADNRGEIVRLARIVNLDVQIFAAKLAKRKYALEHERIAE